MRFLADRFRTRIIPAVLTALGVVFLAAGLLSYQDPVAADVASTPSPAPTLTPATTTPSPSPLRTLPPLGSAVPPSATPTIPVDRLVTRVRVAALKIDLPVIRSDAVPCDVAMEFEDPRFGEPGEGRATYLYAHAQKGMFLPFLTQSQISNGSKMKGMVVEVWTSDDQRFLYVISQVKRHVSSTKAFDVPMEVKTDQVWFQTSEGKGTQPKLQVVADLLSQGPADHDEANPTPRPQAPHVVGGREIC